MLRKRKGNQGEKSKRRRKIIEEDHRRKVE
jgi:hypothetical protein